MVWYAPQIHNLNIMESIWHLKSLEHFLCVCVGLLEVLHADICGQIQGIYRNCCVIQNLINYLRDVSKNRT